MAFGGTTVGLAANESMQITAYPAGPFHNLTFGGVQVIQTGFAPQVMLAGQTIGTFTVNIKATDQYSNIRLMVIEEDL